MFRFGSPARFLGFSTLFLAAVTASPAAAQTATVQQLPIFGAQSTPDFGGRGPSFPVVEVQNVDVCISNCGDLAEDAYALGENTAAANNRIDQVQGIAAVEAGTGVAATWGPAYLSGDHPWGGLCLSDGFAPTLSSTAARCTNSWLNYRSNDSSVLIATNPNRFPSKRYRVRFTVPAFPRDEHGNAIGASMKVKMRVDNWGKVWINGAAVPGVLWNNQNINVAGDEQFAQTVHEGVNNIELVIGDGGGLAGFTFLIELSMVAEEPLSESPAGDGDGDGVKDEEDAFPEDSDESSDTDSDGAGDNGDAFPLDPSEQKDTDGDGVGDNADAFDNDPTETTDTDGDGVGNNADAFDNDPTETTDTDGDGVGNNADAFDNDPTETTDTDGDGVGNNADAFDNDPTETTDTDGDGVGNNRDTFDNSNLGPTVMVGTCNSGVANQLLANGATMNDLIAAATGGNHGATVSSVSQLSNGWKSAGLITGRDHGKIVSCTARSK